MGTDTVVVLGTLKPDGTLELAEKPELPPGPVEVTVKAVSSGGTDDYWSVLQRIWAEQHATGHVPRTREQIDAELNALREEADEELRSLEQLHEECERARRDARRSGGEPE